MAKHLQKVEYEIARRLEGTPAAGSPNRIAIAKLQEWAIEYLEFNDEELERSPHLAGQPHWNLWMMDARLEDALFAVLIFRAKDVEFFCGTGNAYEIKSFADSDFPDSPDEVLTMMSARFAIPMGSIRLERQAASDWLGRGW